MYTHFTVKIKSSVLFCSMLYVLSRLVSLSRKSVQLLHANFDVVTWSDGYLSRERVLSVTQPGTAIALLKFILVIPATNATSERLFTVLRHLKSYLRTTALLERLN